MDFKNYRIKSNYYRGMRPLVLKSFFRTNAHVHDCNVRLTKGKFNHAQ